MALQGKKATLLPNEADYVIVDGEIALLWSAEDTDEAWIQEQIYLLEKEDIGYDPWDDLDTDCHWDGWSWVENRNVYQEDQELRREYEYEVLLFSPCGDEEFDFDEPDYNDDEHGFFDV